MLPKEKLVGSESNTSYLFLGETKESDAVFLFDSNLNGGKTSSTNSGKYEKLSRVVVNNSK